MSATAAELVGREEELRELSSFLDGELPAALVLKGEAGIGKTTIWGRRQLGRGRSASASMTAASPTSRAALLRLPSRARSGLHRRRRGSPPHQSAGERILTVARAGGRPRVVHLDRDNPIISPTWSPDGTRIAFAKGWTNDIPYPFDVPRAKFLAIYLVPAAGGAARTVRAVAGWDLEPDWARR